VKYSMVKDEPIKDMLGNVNSSLIASVLKCTYGGDASTIPTVEYLAPQPSASEAPAGVKVSVTDKEIVYQFGKSLPSNASWLASLAGSELNWL